MGSRPRQVTWSRSAYQALDDALAFLVGNSEEAALRLLTGALDAAASLSTLAERGRVVPELADPSIRELFVFRYRLLYRIRADEVVVVAFLHGARDFSTWRKTQSLA